MWPKLGIVPSSTLTDVEGPTPKIVGRRAQPRLLLLQLDDDGTISGCGASSVAANSWTSIRPAEFDIAVVGHPGFTNTGRLNVSVAWPEDQIVEVLPNQVPPFAFLLCGRARVADRGLVVESITFDTHDKEREIAETAQAISGRSGRFGPTTVPVLPEVADVHAILGSRCTEFTVPSQDDPALDRLIREDLIPACDARGHQPHAPVFASDHHRLPIVPFLIGHDGEVLGGMYKRPGGGEVWLLPSDINRPSDWLRLAMRRWRREAPERFRELPGFDGNRWQTRAERVVQQKLDEVEAERFETATRLDALQQELEDELADRTAQADEGSRRLLTSEAGDAEEAVAEALEALGFKVERVDSTLLTDEAKVEDLRVTDSDDPEWLALAEVRSYKGGAKLADLMKLSRFGMLHAATHGAPPSRTWYIVNQFRERDPSAASRLPVLDSHPDEIQVFAEVGGAVIETSQLFDLVERDDRERAAIRRQLRETTGRLDLEI